ncbi:hypothetical protein AGABI1DRAFT_93597 [Agaricus bisporus var. burnettii JB137-S8]|uniref:Peptidase A1 domain-containing protein n=1 Tax=Agaricus bisporus var. burnettii (strain JB137-S8 / ATCC MYA-4627 / FGSC 10392) TaxID=597362 RepID=K5XQX0_AGABU|nr:uncharacterized protein AGABI1DRAFT_93597 [Agaricus bisporus var. burnettii JB137-S8]EKM77225.1 hypothetical protein AGABI1DRAFT_93597 [Agaricus bisporus var. burnettii JB137-S8]
MFSANFMTIGLLALSAAATPLIQVRESHITLSLSRRVNTTSAHNLLKHDVARVQSLKARAKALQAGGRLSPEEEALVNQPLDNQAVTYIASVGVGSPATFYSLIVDTGSSNTWVGATAPYVQTSTSRDTGDSVGVQYGSGSFSGEEFVDTVTLGSLTLAQQSIGVADTSVGFEGTDGILGIGPVALTQGTLSPDVSTLIPTVTDNLFANGDIDANEIGGVDSSKFTGDINFMFLFLTDPIILSPVTSTQPASFFWGIDQSVRYGASNTILSTAAGIVDTGTTLVLLASDAIARYQAATGAVLDRNTGLLRITTAQFANLQSLFFTAGGSTFELTPNAQIWPRTLNQAIGGNPNSVYLIVGDLGMPSGEGFDFVNGYAFLERYYSVYDTANHRVGFATTPFTFATTN